MIARMLLAVGLGLTVLLGAALMFRAGLQWHEACALAITAPGGIDESRFVDIGGSPQWVQIRGEHRTNPVVIIVHGGPGFALSPFTRVFRSWEADFTVVQWDQPNAGRTFSRNGPQAISIDQVSSDGIVVAEYVRRTLPEAPLVVLGHSWGSAVGLDMIRRRPDLFSAFVGTGQMSSKAEQEALSYRRVLEKLREAGNRKGVDELQRLKPPPYKDMAGLLIERKWLGVVDTPAERSLYWRMAPLVLIAPNMSLGEVRDFVKAPTVAQRASFDEIDAFDARRIGTAFTAPIFIFQGDEDLYTPMEPTIRYLEEVKAPAKELVVLKGGGHDVLLTAPVTFLTELRARVRPVKQPSSR